MTDFLFVNPTDSNILKYEVNGTMLLATKLLQAGFEVEILRFYQFESNRKDYAVFIKDITDRILQIAPKCVSFYTLWPYYHIMLRIACEIKKRNADIITVFGGPQASATAYATLRAMDFVDYICTGEGENTIVPFAETVLGEHKEDLPAIPGLYYRRNGEIVSSDRDASLCDLNTLPHWDDRLFLDDGRYHEPDIKSNHYFMPIDAGRGCPYSCTFCCTSHFWRRTYRLKSARRIVEDILYHNQKYGIKSFWFSHDAFTTNKQLVAEVCDHIQEAGLDITWKCTARIDCITEELVLKMMQAGMTQIELGIETGSLKMQKRINKNLNLEKAKSMISFLLKNKIRVGLFFMYGFPDETEQDLSDTLDLLFSLLDLGVQHASMSFCKFNPATEITEKYFDELVLDPQIKELVRGVSFGYEEEIQMIKEHKAMFPFFYHLNTSVRNEYQYLDFLVHMYQQFPNSIKHLRKLYQGDNLKFYRDFYSKNRAYFEKDMEYAEGTISEHMFEMLDNIMGDLDLPYIQQLKALIKFDYHIQVVSKSKENISIQDTYDFSYIDFRLKLPIEKYSDGKTEILLRKTDGKMDMKVLRMS